MKEPIGGVVLAGDWHGHISQSTRVIKHAVKNEINTIVQVGDFGINQRDTEFLDVTQSELEKQNVTIYFIDGNKDYQPKLYALPFEEDGTKKVRDNIFYLPRGFRWNWHGFSFLGLGGAPSINYKQSPSHIWCREEYITQKDIDKSIQGGPVDFLVSHDSPAGVPNHVDDKDNFEILQRYGRDALMYCRNHRELLKYVTDKVSPRFIVHGHYHAYMKNISKHLSNKGSSVYSLGLDQGYADTAFHTWDVNFDKLKKFKAQLEEMDLNNEV